MAEILLSSEKFIKEVTNISDNLAGKYLLPSLREAQDVKLQGILGSCLFRKLKQLVKDEEISDNPKYKDLLDHCQYFLAYSTIVEILRKVSYKIGNFGVSKSNDENLSVATADEINSQDFYYQSKADAYCLELQQWILDNRKDYPELSECQCSKIASNLYSAATCGVWLGGKRGKIVRRG